MNKRIHVDLDHGDDLDGDGSESSPFRSRERALTVARAGDLITLTGGEYGRPSRVARRQTSPRS